jgi:universal stress protein A
LDLFIYNRVSNPTGGFIMKKYDKILLAVDLRAEDDGKVCEHCLSLAESTGAEITIVHAVDPITSYGNTGFSALNIDRVQTELEQMAEDQVAVIGEKMSIPLDRQYVLTGFVKAVILKTSKKISADLIVVGSHGRHGISALFFGDTAGDVVHNSLCDVLTVPLSK